MLTATHHNLYTYIGYQLEFSSQCQEETQAASQWSLSQWWSSGQDIDPDYLPTICTDMTLPCIIPSNI